MGLGETLCRALAKLVMKAAEDQAKTAFGKLQLCAGPEAVIEGGTHAMGQEILARAQERLEDVEEAEVSEEEEEESGRIATGLNNLNIKTAVTEEEAAEGLASALGM